MDTPTKSSESKEEYLEAIFKLQRSSSGATITRLAGDLHVSPASASQMVSRLSEDGLIVRPNRNRVELSEEGRRLAARLVRRHRLSERFLTDCLNLPWDQVHDEACRLEHVLSTEVESRLAEHLGNPRTCPHGRVIPDEDGQLPDEEATCLAEVRAGDDAVIAFVSDEQPDLLRYLASLGLLPETPIAVEEIAPFGGPMLIRVGRTRYALGREVAQKVFVR